MVDALRQAHRVLAPRGILVDARPDSHVLAHAEHVFAPGRYRESEARAPLPLGAARALLAPCPLRGSAGPRGLPRRAHAFRASRALARRYRSPPRMAQRPVGDPPGGPL